MIFLITKMFVYLLVALGLGAAAGWLWRHQQAAAREADMERQLLDSRSRLPQVETALRTREQQIEGLLAEIHAQEQAVAQQSALVADRDKAVATLERACAGLHQRLETLQAAATAAPKAEPASGDELELHPGDPEVAAGGRTAPTDPPAGEADAGALESPAAAAQPEPAAPASQPPHAIDDGERERLTQALEAARRELERARSALAVEQRRVAELTQERALQHRALTALEQQLEMVRDDTRAAG